MVWRQCRVRERSCCLGIKLVFAKCRDNGATLAFISIAIIASIPTILKGLRRKGIDSVLQLVLV
jgi:hypothetical protein